MKFNINDTLFKIETNDGFHVKKISKNKSLNEVLRFFNLNKKYSIYLIKKQSKTSKIYFVKNKKSIFVLKSSLFKETKYLNLQCELLSNLKSKYLVQLLKGQNGYVFKNKNYSFVVYKKEKGNIFNGKINDLNKIFYSIIQLHKKLKNKKFFNFNLKVKKYKIKEIKDHGKLLLNKRFISKLLSKKIIGKKTKILITKNSFYIKNCINNIVQPKMKKKSLQVVHEDLNHSNILVFNNNIRFIDNESFVKDTLKIAMSHAIFKVLRHVVFINKNKIHYVNNYYKNLCTNLIKKNIFSSHKEIFDMCALRILSDISLIINSFYAGQKKYLYDFEKKILNLIELRYISKLHEFKS